MSDRTAQARAEAERRVRDLFDRKIYGPANSAGYLVGHAEGVVWADANPSPRTITREAADAVFIKVMLGRFSTPDALVATLRELGIEVTDE